MKRLNSSRWSELPIDMLRCVLERLSIVEFHRARMVCRNWYMYSKQTMLRKSKSPWLMLFPFPEDGCVLYNPMENRVCSTKRDFSGIRFLANSGNWFLVLDSRSNLYIIDLFSDKRIDLPSLESIKGGAIRHMRIRGKQVKEDLLHTFENLRGVLWVDENKEEYVVVCCFDTGLAFCKNGHHYFRVIPQRHTLDGVIDMVLKGYMLYVLTTLRHIRLLDLSGKDGFKDKLPVHRHLCLPSYRIKQMMNGQAARESYNIAVTTSGQILLVLSIRYKSTSDRIFRLYKSNHPDDTKIVEVDSLGDEALLLDLGITVPPDHTLGIEPNSIYFTRHDRLRSLKPSSLDICVYNLATKTFKRFLGLSNLKLKDARWFFPS